MWNLQICHGWGMALLTHESKQPCMVALDSSLDRAQRKLGTLQGRSQHGSSKGAALSAQLCGTDRRLALLAGAQRIDWLFHKKPLFLMHWKDGKVPQAVQDKVVVIPGDLHKPGLGLSPRG